MLLELGLYPELSILPDTTKHRDRETQWKKNTTDFCERYIATHDFLDINKASDRPKTAEAPRVSLPVSLLIALRPFLRLRLDLLLVVLAVRGGLAGVAVRV
jgi:hypothetical protein